MDKVFRFDYCIHCVCGACICVRVCVLYDDGIFENAKNFSSFYNFICTTRSFTKSLCVCPPPNSEYLQPNLIWWNFGNAHIWFIIEKLCWLAQIQLLLLKIIIIIGRSHPVSSPAHIAYMWNGMADYLTCSHSPDKLHIWWCRRRLINNFSFSLKNPTRSNKLFSTFYFIVYGGPAETTNFWLKNVPDSEEIYTHTHTPSYCTYHHLYVLLFTTTSTYPLYYCGWLRCDDDDDGDATATTKIKLL